MYHKTVINLKTTLQLSTFLLLSILAIPISHGQGQNLNYVFYRINTAIFWRLKSIPNHGKPLRVGISNFHNEETRKGCNPLTTSLAEGFMQYFHEMNNLTGNKFEIVPRQGLGFIENECSIANSGSSCTHESLVDKADIFITGSWNRSGRLTVKAISFTKYGTRELMVQREIVDLQSISAADRSCWQNHGNMDQERRAEWQRWQQKMQEDFDKVTALVRRRPNATDLHRKAWKGFLARYPVSKNNPYSQKDEELRAEAERQQALAVTDNSHSTDDNWLKVLVAEEDRERAKWQRWQQKMQADFDKVTALVRQNPNATNLHRKAWQWFLARYPISENNPYSQKDDELRTEAARSIQQIEADRLARIEKAKQKAAIRLRKPYEPEMVSIPGGSFMMGSPDNEEGRRGNEGPQHKVYIKAFKMGKYEVTVGQFKLFVQDTNYKGSKVSFEFQCKDFMQPTFTQADNHPVVCVTWLDAVAYTEWLSRKTGKNYRLPTEAEWEYVARAGTSTKYWWGNEIGHNRANCDGDYCGDSYNYTSPVGSFAANPWGIYDTVGNVSEWTCSDYTSSYDGSEMKCLLSGASAHVLRGGSWRSNAGHVRAASRYRHEPGSRSNFVGFRACEVQVSQVR